MMIHQLSDSIHYQRYEYDDQRRLSSIFDSINSEFGYTQVHTLEYDAQGKLIGAIEVSTYNYDGSKLSKRFTFEHDARGNVIRKKIISNSSAPMIMHTYTYDTKNRVLSDTSHDYYRTNDVSSWVTYNYDEYDNIVREAGDAPASAWYAQPWTRQLQFDRQPNPLFAWGINLYVIKGENSVLSRNNIVRSVYDNREPLLHIYQYKDGQPESMVEKVGARTEGTTNFIYE